MSLYKSQGDSEANENEDQDDTPKKNGSEANGEVNNGSSIPLTVPDEGKKFSSSILEVKAIKMFFYIRQTTQQTFLITIILFLQQKF